MKPKNTNDWNEWRRLLLSEIKRLSKESAKTSDRIEKYNEVLVRNTMTLEEHVRRTNLLEAQVSRIDQHVKRIQIIVDVINWMTAKDNLFAKVILVVGSALAAYAIKRYLS